MIINHKGDDRLDIKRIALIIPHTDITLESDLQMNLPENYIIHTQRILLEEVSEEAEKKMVDIELPKSIDYLKGIAEFDAAIFGCTSASAVYGLEGLNSIRNLLRNSFNCSATSAFEAVINEIKEKGKKKASLISPYTDDVNSFMGKSLDEFGINVTYSKGLGVNNDLAISNITPNEILKFIERNKKEIQSHSDVCLISCTNFRALEVIDEISKILEMEVVTSNYSILRYLLNVL